MLSPLSSTTNTFKSQSLLSAYLSSSIATACLVFNSCLTPVGSSHKNSCIARSNGYLSWSLCSVNLAVDTAQWITDCLLCVRPWIPFLASQINDLSFQSALILSQCSDCSLLLFQFLVLGRIWKAQIVPCKPFTGIPIHGPFPEH